MKHLHGGIFENNMCTCNVAQLQTLVVFGTYDLWLRLKWEYDLWLRRKREIDTRFRDDDDDGEDTAR